MLFCQKRVSYWKKSTILKNSEFFFMDLRFRNWTYIQTIFQFKNHHGTSSCQARCVCCIFVNLIFISCHYNNDQMKKLFIKLMSYWKATYWQEKLPDWFNIVTTADKNLINKNMSNTSNLTWRGCMMVFEQTLFDPHLLDLLSNIGF